MSEELKEIYQVQESASLESPFSKYLRTYRLLNSLLLALFFMVGTFAVLWNIVMGLPLTDDLSSDFSDGGKPSSAPKKQQQIQLSQLPQSVPSQYETKQGIRREAMESPHRLVLIRRGGSRAPNDL